MNSKPISVTVREYFQLLTVQAFLFWGIIPYNEAIQRYQEEGILIGQTDLTECKSAFSNIASRICGNDIPLFYGFPNAIKKRYIEAL